MSFNNEAMIKGWISSVLIPHEQKLRSIYKLYDDVGKSIQSACKLTHSETKQKTFQASIHFGFLANVVSKTYSDFYFSNI